jgi:hypothetical protein
MLFSHEISQETVKELSSTSIIEIKRPVYQSSLRVYCFRLPVVDIYEKLKECSRVFSLLRFYLGFYLLEQQQKIL